MLAEARSEVSPQITDSPERPLKRKRPGEGRRARPGPAQDVDVTTSSASQTPAGATPGVTAERDTQSGDAALPAPTIQTIVRDSDDDDEDDDELEFEDVAIGPSASSAAAAGAGSGLSLDLSAHLASLVSRRAERRKGINREEKARRLEIHKAHLVCLLAHVEIRNRWCNDPRVQDALRSLLPEKTVSALLPRSSLNQFSRSESLKKGLQEAKDLFKLKFSVTERGLWRALWAENEDQLKDYQLPEDMDSTKEKSDFLKAARTLKGSRDVGAQLFCALLRSVGVEARLICSLQPLSFVPGAPTMPKRPKTQAASKQPSKMDLYSAAVAKHETKFPDFKASSTTPSPRSRLGHPLATAYHVPSLATPSRPPPQITTQAPKPIRGESPFPVYWVEVLDVAHQKWQPVDPLVTNTQYKPRALEPPASDTLNNMTYVIAFSADSSARDVTRRYAKAYTSKTRRSRIDGFPSPTTSSSSVSSSSDHHRWYRHLLHRYTPPIPTDLDQIELNELAAAEAREPMPRNVADFKDHPVYALERHLRRNEVLVPGAQPSGTVSAGARAGAQLERIYRRSDVRVCRTRERWFRLGRVVKDGQEPVKSIPKRRRRVGRLDDDDGDGNGEDDDDDPDRVGLFADSAPGFTPLYTPEQTELYTPPPVVDGRVPKNRFGNVEVYVPSMIPPGGAHVRHERAAQAAFLLGIDYAPALTGFEFRGRQADIPLPDKWPSTVTYLLRPCYSPHLTETHLRALRTRPHQSDRDPLPEIPRHFPRGPCPAVRIVPITDPNHPACGQAGLFAARDLAPGELILPYLGEVHVGTFPFGRKLGGKGAREGLMVREAEEEQGERGLSSSGGGSSSDDGGGDDSKLRKGSAADSPGADATAPVPAITTPSAADDTATAPVPAVAAPAAAPDNNKDEKEEEDEKDDIYDYAKSDYDLWLDREADLAVDAARMGNEARFINDYRGVPCQQPRSSADGPDGSSNNNNKNKNRRGKRGAEDEVGIRDGDEVLVSYGKGFWAERRRESMVVEEETGPRDG
ncbi:hypothetical protein VTJ49DRAFT_6485 [Mycothermus thermophilus]|uniref:SET domain-containing protein n=1 Tax=Humicola insolens TaxID=85995 RepID=A0ABR3VK77_HUMIN